MNLAPGVAVIPDTLPELSHHGNLSPVSPKPFRANCRKLMNNTQTLPTDAPSTTPATSAEVVDVKQPRQQPIAPPSEPRQYRAIGLVRGRYQPSEELTKGLLLAENGTEIDCVLLGRTISLVKNHLDLAQSYLWVVYPRTRQNDETLHVQIAGVWNPEVLHPDRESSTTGEVEPEPEPILENGYFSIRGDVIYYSYEEAKAIIKIQQTPRKPTDKRKFFKLHLQGLLPSDNPLNHFWDVHVRLEGDNLLIQEVHDLGPLPKRKFTKGKGGGGFKGNRFKSGGSGGARTTEPPRKPEKKTDSGTNS